MRLRLSGFVVGLGLSLGVGVLPAQAQISDAQVGAFVEALRQAAPQTGQANDGLYSDWQVKAENIPRWAKSCLGRELTPDQFENSPTTARGIISCVTRDVLRDEYRNSGNNEAVAVLRTAAWWMTGDPNRYNRNDLVPYTQRVLSLYQQNKSTAPSPQPQTSAPSTSNTPYDRYMQAGYDATQQKNHQQALVYFKRALDERPNDTYATQAIRNVEAYLKGNRNTPQSAKPTSPTKPSSTTATALNQQQAIAIVNRWLEAKADIFAPPFDQKQLKELATGELYTSMVKPDGVLDWLKRRQAYYRYGVQKVEGVDRFAVSADRATIELRVTEDRTLYLKGMVDPRQTDFSARQVRYSLELVNGNWKIADYKTIDGSLLERAVLEAETSSDRR